MTLCYLTFLLMASAPAQDTLSRADLSEVSKTNREQLHPGGALKIRGIAQEGNDFLASTPALRSAPTAVELVGAEEAHSRRLAMYESGKRFDTAPNRSQRMTANEPHQPMRSFKSARSDTGSPDGQDEPGGGSSKYLLPGAFIGLVFYAMRKLAA